MGSVDELEVEVSVTVSICDLCTWFILAVLTLSQHDAPPQSSGLSLGRKHDALSVEEFLPNFKRLPYRQAPHLAIRLFPCADSHAEHPAPSSRTSISSLASRELPPIGQRLHRCCSAPTHLLTASTRTTAASWTTRCSELSRARPTHMNLKVRGALSQQRAHLRVFGAMA